MKASELVAFVLLLFSMSGWASDKMCANIQIYQTLHLGSTELAPDEYKMTWIQSEANAKAAISQGKKVIATVPARVAQVCSGYRSPVLHIDSVPNTVSRVGLPTISISFGSENATPAS